MDLSAYLNFSAVLTNNGTSPIWTIIDTSAYPAGVAQTIAGVLSITQPDFISDTNNNFAQPNIYWNSGALVQANRPLRLANNGRFQNGGYSITYTVRAAGYTDTVLTKTFVLNYTAPTPVLSPAFDNFTPSLKVNDASNWTVANLTLISVSDTWAALIRSVGGTNQNITGAGTTFDLAYMGSYYDAFYDVTLTSVVTWQMPGQSPWVTLVDTFVPPAQTFQSEIPPTLALLLTSLTVLKNQLDATGNNPNYTLQQAKYAYAVSLYTHLIDRGQASELAGLSSYVWELQTIFNNNVTPAYVNTNAIIPAYVWTSGGGGGSVAWSAVTSKPSSIQIPGTVGGSGMPVVGGYTFTDGRLAGIGANQIIVVRDGGFEFQWTKANAGANSITFTNVWSAQETIVVIILPL